MTPYLRGSTSKVLAAGMTTVGVHAHSTLQQSFCRQPSHQKAANVAPICRRISGAIHHDPNRRWSSHGPKRDDTFDDLDSDGDGKVSKGVFEQSGRKMGDYDADGDGLVSKQEWSHGRPTHQDKDNWKNKRYYSPPSDGHWGLIGAHPGNYPTLMEAAQQQRHYYEMSNEVLLLLAAQGNQDAVVERMIREVMHVDQVHWRVGARTVQEMEVFSGGPMTRLLRLPYSLGAGVSLGAAVLAMPLCFSTTMAFWFNENFVTADIPPPEDLQTILETGSWTWNWMEPPLGAISFFLLCLQFARTQTGHMWKGAGAQGPYNAYLKRRRYDMLAKKYPQYSPAILKEYSLTLTARAGSKTTDDALESDPKHQAMCTAEDKRAM